MNDSKKDVLNFLQHNIKRKIYTEDDMLGFIEIGKQRKSQEDSLLFMAHPYSKDTKMLLIADGMGGLEYGEVASNLVAKEIMDWFINYDFANNGINNLLLSYKKKINYIDELLRCDIIDSGSTIVSAICEKDYTLITNVGDSRCYIYNDIVLKQITEDHNLAWKEYLNGVIRKDELRFCSNNNLLTSKIGGRKKILKVDSFIINNSIYSKLLLCSDGLSDVVPDDCIRKYLMNFETTKVDDFLEYVLNYKEIRNNHTNSLLKEEIIGGGDNISVIVKTNKKVRK